MSPARGEGAPLDECNGSNYYERAMVERILREKREAEAENLHPAPSGMRTDTDGWKSDNGEWH